MENEGNRSLINKKASEDQFRDFCEFNFGDLSLFSPSLILLENYSFLQHSWRSVTYLEFWTKKAKEEKESAIGHQD